MGDQRPHEIVWTVANAVVSRCVHVVADRGLANEVGDEAVSTSDLASRCDADADVDALERMLRFLAALSIF